MTKLVFQPTGAVIDDEDGARFAGQECEVVAVNPDGWDGKKVRFADGTELLVRHDELVEDDGPGIWYGPRDDEPVVA